MTIPYKSKAAHVTMNHRVAAAVAVAAAAVHGAAVRLPAAVQAANGKVMYKGTMYNVQRRKVQCTKG